MKIFLYFLLFTFNHFVLSQDRYIDYVSPYTPVPGSSGMVVSQNNLSSDIGIEILNKGGNAVDAAVAVGFSLSITLPRAGGIGGGGFMLVYLEKNKEIFFIDYRSKSPLNTNLKDIFKYDLIDEYKKIDFNKIREGYKAAAMPGTVAGLLDAHANFGVLTLEEILEPVIKLANDGIYVSNDLHKAIKNSKKLKKDNESKRIYYKNGQSIQEGSLLKRPDLARTLSLISSKGKDGFYKGETQEKFIKAMAENNGFISSDDFASYKTNIGSPLISSYRGNYVFSAGPPSGGGLVVSTSLNILNGFNLNKYGSNSAATYHLLAEALRRGHNNRSHHMGDPNYYNVPMNTLLSKERTLEFIKTINLKKATKSSKIKPLDIKNESRNTTHYSIVDKDGNAVSNTFTLGYSFGSGVTVPGTGVLLNNQMGNFAYRYGDSSVQGRTGSPANKYEPGKRPMSTMAPTMVFDSNKELMLITGSPGGSTIPASILRVISGIVDFKLDIGAATMLPRVHKDWPYKGLDYETTISKDTLSILDNFGHNLEPDKTIGSTQSIHIIDGIRYGYSDLRRPNASVAVQIN